jgi:cation diffusion facilitator family transporter
LAIGLSAFAYSAARRHAHDTRFAFGTWKMEVLGGYTSAIFLLAIALLMFFSSFERIYQPLAIEYAQAIAVAVVGLLVNLLCAYILFQSGHHQGHKNEESHQHHPGSRPPKGSSIEGSEASPQDQGHDLNLRAAYLHVASDAATSLFAILALVLGWLFGFDWLDPLGGILGAVLIAFWSKNLLLESSKVLLDCEMDHPIVLEIETLIAEFPGKGHLEIADLHVWRVAKNSYSCAMVLVSEDRQIGPQHIKKEIDKIKKIAHSTVEIQHVLLA